VSDSRCLHAYLDVEYPSGLVYCFADLTWPEDELVNFLLAGDPETRAVPVFPLRGLPVRTSLTVLLDFSLLVMDAARPPDAVTPEQAAALVEEGSSEWLRLEGQEVYTHGSPTGWLSRPDMVGVSWLLAEELEEVARLLTPRFRESRASVLATVAAMRALEASENRSRFVFWFT
jgi:hypothetical protein